MTNPTSGAPVTAKKSFKAGCVAIDVRLKATGWGRDHAKIEAGTDLTTDQARALAQSLMELADNADAKVAATTAKEQRRRAWINREVAAGRMKRINAGEFFHGR